MQLTVHRHGGRQHNLIRSEHNRATHKYEKQRYRTAMNKVRHIKKAATLKAAASARKESQMWVSIPGKTL